MEAKTPLKLTIRRADVSDVDSIMSILNEVADQVPINLSTPQHVAAMRQQIYDLYLTEFSLVAIHEDGMIVGFQLAKQMSWNDDQYIHLAYAAVMTRAAGHKVFRQLIEAEKLHHLPLVAEVKAENKSAMVERLRRYHFRPFAAAHTDSEHTYRWDPTQPET